MDGAVGETLLGVDRKCPVGMVCVLAPLPGYACGHGDNVVFFPPKPWPLNFYPCFPSHPFVQKMCWESISAFEWNSFFSPSDGLEKEGILAMFVR